MRRFGPGGPAGKGWDILGKGCGASAWFWPDAAASAGIITPAEIEAKALETIRPTTWGQLRAGKALAGGAILGATLGGVFALLAADPGAIPAPAVVANAATAGPVTVAELQ